MNPSTRSARVFVDLPFHKALKPGMFIAGGIGIDNKPVLALPHRAIIFKEKDSHVFLVQADQTVKKQQVTVGERFADQVEIVDGLTEEDRVVMRGASFLLDGDKVAVSNLSQRELSQIP